MGGFLITLVLDMHLSIYEHQSTVCPNMPIRSLVYFSSILEDMTKEKNIYGHKLVKIPTPHFAVFYNGAENQPEVYEQRLSDAFEHPVDRPEIELVCTVYNINRGKNVRLLEKCRFLREYMIFVDYVRNFYKENDHKELGSCIEQAIDRCIEEDVLRRFLMEHRLEVVKVVQMDYTFERQIELERIDSREEGRVREFIDMIGKKVNRQKSLEQIAKEIEEDPEDIRLLYDIVCSYAPECNEDQIYQAYLRKK